MITRTVPVISLTVKMHITDNSCLHLLAFLFN